MDPEDQYPRPCGTIFLIIHIVHQKKEDPRDASSWDDVLCSNHFFVIPTVG